MLLHHACCVLSCLRCNGHSLLLSSYLPRIGRIENPFCTACVHLFQNTSYLILHCQLWTICVVRSLAIFCLSTTSGPGPGVFPGFWGLMVFRHQSIPRRGRITTTTTTTAKLKLQTHYYVTKGVSKFRRS